VKQPPAGSAPRPPRSRHQVVFRLLGVRPGPRVRDFGSNMAKGRPRAPDETYTDYLGVSTFESEELAVENAVNWPTHVATVVLPDHDGFSIARTYPDVRKITFHELRHTFGTQLAAAHVPLRTVQERMGHQDAKTTEIYRHDAPDPGGGAAQIEGAFRLGPNFGPKLRDLRAPEIT
jgi:Phage integrase family